MRVCSKCEEQLPETEEFFWRNGKFWRGDCKNCARDRDARRLDKMLYRYGVTASRYQEMLVEQGGGCAICGEPPDEPFGLVVDHDHTCCPVDVSKTCGGCVRGLLCTGHNKMLGFANDSEAVLHRAAAYLRETRISG